EPDIDVSERTKRRLYRTTTRAKYDLGDKTYLDADLQNRVADYVTHLSSTEWQTHFWFNYNWTQKVTVGTGISGGVLDVELSGEQTYEQALTRVTYAGTEKLSIEADGGVEFRQTNDNSNIVTPVFMLTATYRPFEATQLKLSASRHI